MGAILDQIEIVLARWRRAYAGRPRREMVQLLLLALEREEVVAVAYRDALMVLRLEAMPIGAEVRALIRQSLSWAWKDEEMHAVYLRGVILRLGGPWLRARAYSKQVTGVVAGWSISVKQHVSWRRAPLARAVASAIVAAASVAGQIPRDVRRHLRFAPFREYCLFNVDAELTARLCYDRMLELGGVVSELPESLVDDLRRVRDDEDRHVRIFSIVAEALDPEDRLAPGVTPVLLAEQIGTVGEDFLPRDLRSTAASHPLGVGGRVWVVAGDSASEKRRLFRKLLDDSDLDGRLRERERAVGRPLRVAIKPAFMLGYHRKDQSVLTDPELLADLADRLRALGCADVAVVEAPSIYDRFYAHRSVGEVARYFGLESPSYRLVDLSEEQVPHVYRRGLAQGTVGRTWMEADFRITFGKMRSHPTELVFLTVGNVESIGARSDQFLFPERQARRESAIMMLLDDFPPHFALLDAYDSAADGLMGVMGCPRPKVPRRLYAAPDALALDAVAARHMGVPNPRESNVLQEACHWFGDPSGRIEVVGTDAPIHGWRGPYDDDLSAFLSILALPVYARGSGRGTLFVPEMDEAAFPPASAEGTMLRLGRRALRRLLGLRLPT